MIGKDRLLLALFLCTPAAVSASAQVYVEADVVHPVSSAPIENGVVVVEDGKITAVGPIGQVEVPEGLTYLGRVAVVTPGLVDVRSVVGLAGQFNDEKADQEQHEDSAPMQPELRALDAYNPRERLVRWVRGFGVTTVQTGHAPEELIPGQLFLVKTTGDTVEDATIRPFSAVAATLTSRARRDGASAPGTRGKMMSLLRAELLKAREYAARRAEAEEKPDRDLRLEALAAVLAREVPLVLTAHRAQDIASALRLAGEFELDLVLDGAAEAYLMLDEIREAGVPVYCHATMVRAVGETENLTLRNAALLHGAGIPFAIQSGYENYVPKTRVILFEAAVAASHDLGFEAALEAITLGAARILRIDDRVGSLESGKDGDLALYDGDPFEYTSHCVGTVIAGELVSSGERQ